MGATILLRDAGLDVLPTEENVQEDSTYHATRLADAQRRLDELEDMDTADASEAAEREHADAVRAYSDAQFDYYGMSKRYEVMRAKVAAWEPPTEDHVGFKEFMLSQLDESADFDLHEPKRPERGLSAAEWLKREIEKAERDRAYHRQQMEGQAERNEKRVEWIRELRASLEGVPA